MRKASKMQLHAIDHGKGPAIVIAGPGSGKTFTIIQRIFRLILQDHASPDRILTITFTKAAALEMQSRYLKESENNPALKNFNTQAQFGTFHGICYAILKESGLIKNFSLIKETDKRKIIGIILQNKGIEGACEYDNISLVLDAISRKKNLMTVDPPLNLLMEEFERIYFEYEDILIQQKLLDFDDMLLKCLNHMQSDRFFCRKWQDRFDYILVDEFQDINEVQYRLLKLLAAPSDNLFVVGDDDQSIYGFRGSAPQIMHKFTDDYKGAKEIYLSENYRSGNKIVELSDRVIRRNSDRFKKTPVSIHNGGNIYVCFKRTRKEEECQLLKDIKSLSESELHDSAVLVRTNIEAFQYMALLKMQGITVKEQTKQREDIFNHFITEDFKAFLKFCYEGNKRSDFIKIMNKPNIFLARQALTGEVTTPKELLSYYQNNKEMCRNIKILFRHFETASGLSPALSIQYFRKVMGYDEYLKQKAGQSVRNELHETADQVQLLLKHMKRSEKTDMFFERYEKEQDKLKQKCSRRMSDGISVITMHSSKGLEFDSVFLPDLNEGVIPGRNSKTKESIAEERRLLYVAITRARESLYLYYTKERNRKLTRFLNGIISHQSQ